MLRSFDSRFADGLDRAFLDGRRRGLRIILPGLGIFTVVALRRIYVPLRHGFSP